MRARKRVSRKAGTLYERLLDCQLPYDLDAERCAIGAVMLAPNGHAKRLSRRAYRGHFFDEARGWLWEEIGLALVKCKFVFDDEPQIGEWIAKSRIIKRFETTWRGCLIKEMRQCMDAGFWWHGDWYVDQVVSAAKVRAKIVTATDHLREALDAGDEWRRQR